MSLPAYPAYRDSGVAWLGQVPAGWRVGRLRFLADIRPSGVDKHSLGGELPVRLCNYGDVYKNDRITDALAFMEATATPSEIERFSLRAGDVLITKDSETPDDIAAAALVEPSAAGVLCGYHLALLRPVPGAIGGAFLFWAFKAPETLAQCSVRAQGITRFGLSSGAIGDVLVSIPPPAEQRAIAAFLDRECGKIDALVAEQERLIALLKEKRQAVISHAVTKGLDPSAPMKDSGVPWLGQVPAHWLPARVKDCFRIINGATPRSDVPEYWDGDVVWVTPADLSGTDGWDVAASQRSLSAAGLESCAATVVPPGSIVISTRAPIGSIGIAAVPLCTNQGCRALVPPSGAETRFFAYALTAFTPQLNLHGRGTTFLELSGDALGAFAIPLPPPAEQRAIAAFLDRECGKIDALVKEVERAIALLKERRAALISAAVTGKIDVRGLVSPAEAKAA